MATRYLSDDEVFGTGTSYLSDEEVFGVPAPSAGGGRGFINPPMAGQPQPTVTYAEPARAPAPVDYGQAAIDMMGTPMSAPPPASTPAAPRAPAYKNRLEALDDAVNLVEEGADFKRVAQSFSQIGIGEGDIIAHGIGRKSPMFQAPDLSRRQIDQYVKPEQKPIPQGTGEMRPIETSLLEDTINLGKRVGARTRQSATNTLFQAGIIGQDDAARMFAQDQRKAEAAAPPESVQEGLRQFGEAKTFSDAAIAIATNPKATFVALTESLLQTAPAMALAVSRVPMLMRATGVGVTSGALEFGSAMADVLGDRGVDLTNAAAISSALSKPDVVNEIREKGATRGLTIGVIDALTAGFAGKFLRPVQEAVYAGKMSEQAARRATLGAWGKELGMQVAGGAGGEALGQQLTGEFKPADILLEGLGEGFTAPLEARGNLRESRALSPNAQIASAIEGAGRSFENLTPADTQAIAIDMLRTERGTSDMISPAATVANFTPPDSATKRAGLVDIVVPVPGAEAAAPLGPINPTTEQQFGLDTLRMGGVNVGTSGTPGGLAGAGGGAGGGILGGGLDTAGLGAADATGAGGGLAGLPGANDQSAVPAGSAAGQQAAGLTGAAQPLNWTGRAKTGYASEQDAEQAMATASTVIDTRQTHDWRVEPMGNGRFQLVGYQKETNLGTQTPQAQQTQAPGAAAPGQMAGATQGGATGIPAATGTPLKLSDSERAGLRLAPTAPVRELKSLNQQLDQQIGVTFSPVRSEDLTDSQRLASTVARLLGKTLTVVHQETGARMLPNGMIDRLGGKHLVVADNSDDAPLFLAVHEGYHGLPEDKRKTLNAALLEVFNQDQKGEFLREFSYNADNFDEEAPAMMAQAISKRADFWEDLRTKMGNKEFGEVAKVILTKLGDIITGAKKQYGEDFVNKYITDIAKARDLLSTAYAEAMREQGLKPDVELTGGVMASSRAAADGQSFLKASGFNEFGPAEGEWVKPVSKLGDVIAKVVSAPGEPVRMEISADYMGRRFGTKVAEGEPAIKAAIEWASSGIQQGREKLAARFMAEERGLPGGPQTPMLTASNRSRLDLNFKDVIKRTPELQAAAAKVQAGEMTAAEYDKLVNETKPVEPYTSVPQPASDNEIRTALTSDKVERIGVPSRTLKAGDPVGLRLDIPAYSNHGTWVVSVHQQEAGYNAGKSIGYEPVAAATNVTFGVVEKAAMNIAAGKPKATIAVIKGGWKPTTPAEAKLKADQALKSKDWVQVGMDPERHSYFYDRATMEPVTAADEVIQIGPLVLAKNPTYGKKSEFMFSNRARPAPKASEYDPKVDNYAEPKTADFLPSELVQRARDYITKFQAEAPPVSLSGADRIRAERLLRPRLALAEQAKLEYDQKILDIASRVGALGQKLAPLKGMKRAAEKLAIEEGFKVDNMKDLLRSTIVVDSYDDAQAVVDEIRKEFDVLPNRIKNRTDVRLTGPNVEQKGFLPSGYGDVLINVRMPNGTLAEIQINTPEMLAAKGEEGHKLYEIERDQPERSEIRQAVVKAQAEYYREAAAAAARRKNASSEEVASRGNEGRSSSSPVESSSLNTLPSGNLTQSSPEKSAKNEQPAGKEAGTFIAGSPDKANISQSLYADKPATKDEIVVDGVQFSNRQRDLLDVPTIELKDLVDKKVFGIKADLMEAGRSYTGIDGSQLMFPVEMMGGPNFPRLPASAKARVAWTVRGGAVLTKIKDQVKKADYVLVVAMNNNSHLTNSTAAEAYIKTVQAYLRDGRISSENLLALDAIVRSPKNKLALKDFPGFESPNIIEYIDKLSFNQRGALAEILEKKEAQVHGLPNLDRFRRETLDPDYAGYRQGDAMLVLEIDKENPTIKLGEEGSKMHPSYPLGLRGRVVGKLAKGVNYETIFRDYFNFAVPNFKRGAQDAWYSFDRLLPVQKITPAIANSIAAGGFKAIQSPRQAEAALAMGNGNWLASGKTKATGGVSVQEFVDALAANDGAAALTLYTAKEVKAGIKAKTFQVYQLGDRGGDKGLQIFFGLKRGRPWYADMIEGIGDNEVEVVSVTNNEPGAPGIGIPAIITKAISEGATVLDAFAVKSKRFPNGFLPEMYGQFGFEEIGRIPFDPSYYDANQLKDLKAFWSKGGWNESDGYPDVVVMRWKGKDEDRAAAVERYVRTGQTSVSGEVPRYARTAAGESDRRGDSSGRAEGGARGGDRGQAGGDQGAGNAAPVVKRAYGSIQELATLSDGDIQNLGLKPQEIARLRAFLAQPGAAPASPTSGVQFSKRVSPADKIKWREITEVKREIGLDRLPDHIIPFADFMGTMATKAVNGGLTVRDVIKAYTIARSSMNRSAVTTSKVVANGLRLPAAFTDPKIRPEGAFGYWLLSPMGQRYLNAAEVGITDQAAIDDAVKVMSPFGTQNALGKDLERAASGDLHSRLPGLTAAIVKASKGDNAVEDWQAALDNLYGVREAKKGFLGSLLGFGQLPTFDARQINVNVERETKEETLRALSSTKAREVVSTLAKRMDALSLTMDPKYAPFYQHLAHHAVWDAVGGTETTHSDVVKSMLMASNRALPKVSPQSALDRDIADGAQSLAKAMNDVRAGKSVSKIVIGRLPHVLNMLGARTQDFAIASSIVQKIFDGKHRDEFPDVKPIELVRALYRPAMIFRDKGGSAREYELVLPITNKNGAMLVPIKVSVEAKQDPFGAVMSAYNKRISTDSAKPKEMTLMRRIQEGNLLYVDPMLAKRAITGRERGADRDGVKLNDKFLSWQGVWPTIEKLIQDRRAKTDVDLMKWIGDNYKPESSAAGMADAPAFSKRAAKPELDKDVVSLFKDLQDSRGLGRIRVQERVDAHPMAETIRRVDNEFMDILERLDDAGLVKINCK